MKHLSKEDMARKEEITARMHSAYNEMKEKIEDANDTIRQLNEDIAQYVSEYEEATNEAKDFTNEIFSKQEEYCSGKSEKWAESEVGETYNSWMCTWEEYSPRVDTNQIDEFDCPDDDAITEFENLPNDVDTR